MSGLVRRLAFRTPLGWRQLRHHPARLAVAIAGVVFANLLIFMQLGVMGALFETAVKPVRLLRADIMLMSPDARVFGQLGTLPRRRLYQALGVEGVGSGTTLQVGTVEVRTPGSPPGSRQSALMLFGIDPDAEVFANPGVGAVQRVLRLADTALLDRLARTPLAGAVAALGRGETVPVEVAGRTVSLRGTFALGASFDSDGSAIVSDQTFLRLFPRRSAGAVSAVLLRLRPGADPAEVMARLREALPAEDTQVQTTEAYVASMKAFMANNTPIGFVFSFGVAFGVVIGFAIVFQVLSADVNDHLGEYATLRAMGYGQGWLLGVVFEQALVLAGLGFVPGVVLALGLYGVIGLGTELAVAMPWSRPLLVLGLTLGMCAASGAVATRRLAAADPADVF